MLLACVAMVMPVCLPAEPCRSTFRSCSPHGAQTRCCACIACCPTVPTSPVILSVAASLQHPFVKDCTPPVYTEPTAEVVSHRRRVHVCVATNPVDFFCLSCWVQVFVPVFVFYYRVFAEECL